MPRRVRPRWNEVRACWEAKIGEPGEDGRARPVRFPRSIVRDDEAGAWEFLRSYRAGRRPVEVRGLDPTVHGLFELYAAALEQRVAEGRLAAAHFRSVLVHLSKFADFAPSGGVAYGDQLARSMSPGHVDAFVVAMSARYAASYVDDLARSVAAAFNWSARPAVPGGLALLEVSPIAGYQAPVVPRAPERFAERSLAAVFLRLWRRRVREASAILGPWRVRVERLTLLLERCLIHTGARPGELVALWWSDLRWDAGVNGQGQRFAKGVIEPGRWKAGAKTGRPRTIYFSPVLTRALRREYGRADRHPTHVFWHGAGRGGNGPAVPWESGSALSQKIRSARRRCLELAAGDWIDAQPAALRPGLESLPVAELRRRGFACPIVDEGPSRVVNYLWRHTSASTLLMLGVDLVTVAELLGTSVEMVRHHYGHLLDAHLAAAAERLGAARTLLGR